MRYLTLSIGAAIGFAIGSKSHIISGTWGRPRGRGAHISVADFRQRLDEIHQAYPLDRVYVRDVRRRRSDNAARIHGVLTAVLTEWCEENNVRARAYPTARIKRVWTGKANAVRGEMFAEAHRRGFDPKGHKEAAALALMHLALCENERGAFITDEDAEAFAMPSIMATTEHEGRAPIAI